MNELRDNVLRDILKDPKCYDTRKEHKGKLKLDYVIQQMYIAKEALFMDEVMWLYMARFAKKVKAWGILETEWEPMEAGCFDYFEIPFPANPFYADMLSSCVDSHCQSIWYCNERWAWNEPTLDELKQLTDTVDIMDYDYRLVQKSFI